MLVCVHRACSSKRVTLLELTLAPVISFTRFPSLNRRKVGRALTLWAAGAQAHKGGHRTGVSQALHSPHPNPDRAWHNAAPSLTHCPLLVLWQRRAVDLGHYKFFAVFLSYLLKLWRDELRTLTAGCEALALVGLA